MQHQNANKEQTLMKTMQGSSKIIINASPEKIYTYLRDFNKHIEWNHQPTHMEKLTKGDIDVGTKFKTKEQATQSIPPFIGKLMLAFFGLVLGNAGYTIAEITALDSPNHIAWQAAAPARNGYDMKANWELLITPTAKGTQVEQTFYFMPQRWFSNLMTTKSLENELVREVGRNLENLKSILEKEV